GCLCHGKSFYIQQVECLFGGPICAGYIQRDMFGSVCVCGVDYFVCEYSRSSNEPYPKKVADKVCGSDTCHKFFDILFYCIPY
ncbi:MAG: hypothetical protein J6T83_07090, partial [Paludibacteraceae bacterium]|nr:hypothetical protein [Paludibacteraceae bacterium]